MNYSQLNEQIQEQDQWETEKMNYMDQRTPHLEMLMAREQLMEDIDSIIEDFCPFGTEGNSELVRVLCDAVCKNFPA